MGTIECRCDLNNDILITPREIGEGVWAELCSLFLAYGGSPYGPGMVITPLALRLVAGELGNLLIHHEIEANYDNHVRQLLDSHVKEVNTRKEAEDDNSILPPADVLSLAFKTGRFGREFTSSQVRNLGRLLHLSHGADFSVPGAGKTTVLLALYEAARGTNLVDRLLVVAPKNAFLSWEDELTLCYPEEAKRPYLARIVGGAQQAKEVISSDPEIALITYQFLPNILESVRSWVSQHKTHVVLDESHRIKSGFTGVYANAALQLIDVAVRRDILSGTPIPNSPEDLRAQLDFLWPGQHILPELTPRANEDEQVMAQVQKTVEPFFVRTTKQELHLPPLQIIPVRVELGPLQRDLYDLIRSEAKRITAGFSSSDARLLRRLGAHVMKLLQAASNPMLLASSEGVELGDEAYDQTGRVWDLLREIARSEQSAKITSVAAVVEDTMSQTTTNKILIWTCFVQNVLVLEKLFDRYNPVCIYGAIATGSDEDADTREGRIRRFHSDSSCRVMIANPAACSEGISLHRACHKAIYLDRTFNAAHYLQSVDRIHRLGLPMDTVTTILVLEAERTIDSRVATRLKTKIDSMCKILNDPGLAALAYDPADVVEEFPAGIQPDDVEEILGHLVEEEAND